jgi:hypothetical protein
MEPKIEFIDSAFRHGYGEDDIRHTISVFHAMKCRKSFRTKLGL